MNKYNLLEDDTKKIIDRLQKMKLITSFEASDIANILIRKEERYKNTKQEDLSGDILPILFSLVAEEKLKLKYIAFCPSCNIPMKETADMELMAETLECYQCGEEYGYGGENPKIIEKFYFTSHKIIN